MEAHLAQWLALLLRWGHVITGIAWIGTSFYFNWLNGRLAAQRGGETPELWSVHGGAFYRVTKHPATPGRLPETLHWFKWEAYATWLTGLALLALIYYWQAGAYLVRPDGPASSLAVAIGLVSLLGAWFVYDALCRSPLAARPVSFSLSGLGLATLLAWALSELLAPRAAYLHLGAALGTIMAANVFRVIIPGQREIVAALAQGRAPEIERGRQAALRSLHNNYLTLPVLFVMVSVHYPATYGHAASWALLAAVALLGAGTRHWFNLRNQGRRNVWILPVAAVGLIAIGVGTAPRGGGPAGGSGDAVSFQEVRVVIAARCAPCHSAAPTAAGFYTAPGGITLDTPEQIIGQAQAIYDAAVATESMPLGNETGMTADERALIGRWVRAGAPAR